MIRAALRFLLLTALLCYAALSLTVALIVLLCGGGVWPAIYVGVCFPAHFFIQLVSP